VKRGRVDSRVAHLTFTNHFFVSIEIPPPPREEELARLTTACCWRMLEHCFVIFVWIMRGEPPVCTSVSTSLPPRHRHQVLDQHLSHNCHLNMF
jgi:hypothetical protein